MRLRLRTLAIASALALCPVFTIIAAADRDDYDDDHRGRGENVQLGPRPFYLVDKLQPGKLKDALQRCAEDRRVFHQTDFSIGHRGGGTLQIPEHTKESHEAGARMGAGILECDVTFTSDKQLVCRHDQCDLHTTTNILVTPLADKCSRAFSPATFDPSTGARLTAASALCCTSDLTLDEFKSLKGKMDASDPNATTPQEFQGGTPNWRTDLYATGGTLLSHKESIRLITSLGAKFTPELKGPNRNAALQVETVFGSQTAYAQAMIDDYKEARIDPKDVFAQSFNLADILYWIQHEPRFGKQAVYLNDHFDPACTPPQPCGQDPNDSDTWDPPIKQLVKDGVQIIAPPMWVLLTVDADGKIVPSKYARAARKAGLDIITWTTERSGRIFEEVFKGGNDYYYQSTIDAYCENPVDTKTCNDGVILVNIDVLARQVGVLGVFSDWAATTSFYANCMGLK
jgi:glycerophosphoryl diester phosphodiesterase